MPSLQRQHPQHGDQTLRARFLFFLREGSDLESLEKVSQLRTRIREWRSYEYCSYLSTSENFLAETGISSARLREGGEAIRSANSLRLVAQCLSPKAVCSIPGMAEKLMAGWEELQPEERSDQVQGPLSALFSRRRECGIPEVQPPTRRLGGKTYGYGILALFVWGRAPFWEVILCIRI